MQEASRIPVLDEPTPEGARDWFVAMHEGGMLFHPDDDPAQLLRVSDGSRTFTADEAECARAILGELHAALGDGVYDACYPVFMKASGVRLDA